MAKSKEQILDEYEQTVRDIEGLDLETLFPNGEIELLPYKEIYESIELIRSELIEQ